ncbi:MAG: trypsin-like peptidase domain-containing protein, partial [Kiritimatiellae bacterium]|nr:trypsin-like peptidase domain-containing protein [Kiritimatiellia bacterium]
MNLTSKSIIAVLGIAAGTAFTVCAQENAEEGSNPLNAVVLIEASTTEANIFRPWQNLTDGGSGSGVVIAPGRILTCAHCVADASYIRVRKNNEDSLYHGSVAFIDNDADLALVKVDAPAFMSDVMPMEIGETPHVQSEVLAIGYPIGGTDISFTRGIVSRIEDIRYTHGWKWLLGIQVDAAINPGNSGGPVIDTETGKIAGIAFQGDNDGESLGYMIPPDIIRHFLKDIEDGKVDGFSDFLFAQDQMESEAKRRYYRMDSKRTGVIVEDVAKILGDDSIRTDDIILEIDGYKVSNNGKIRIEGNESRSLYYPIYLRQIGEKVPVKVFRDGAVVETSILAAKRDSRIRRWMFDTRPDYFLFGGIVFTTASYNYMVAAKAEFHDDVFADKEFDGDEAVVISDVLPD